MAVQTPKKPSRSSKGTPPNTPEETLSGSGITNKPSSSDLVPMNFAVSAEFRKQYRMAAAQNDMSMVDVLKESFDLFKAKHGMH